MLSAVVNSHRACTSDSERCRLGSVCQSIDYFVARRVAVAVTAAEGYGDRRVFVREDRKVVRDGGVIHFGDGDRYGDHRGLVTVPSLTRNVKLSEPVKPEPGV